MYLQTRLINSKNRRFSKAKKRALREKHTKTTVPDCSNRTEPAIHRWYGTIPIQKTALQPSPPPWRDVPFLPFPDRVSGRWGRKPSRGWRACDLTIRPPPLHHGSIPNQAICLFLPPRNRLESARIRQADKLAPRGGLVDLRPFCLSLSFFFALIGEGEEGSWRFVLGFNKTNTDTR